LSMTRTFARFEVFTAAPATRCRNPEDLEFSGEHLTKYEGNKFMAVFSVIPVVKSAL
jgi:hypothetical protein